MIINYFNSFKSALRIIVNSISVTDTCRMIFIFKYFKLSLVLILEFLINNKHLKTI